MPFLKAGIQSACATTDVENLLMDLFYGFPT